MKEPLILVGGGGHCLSCIDVIELGARFQIFGIVDTPENIGRRILTYRIFETDSQLPDLIEKYKNFIITMGQIKTGEKRKKLFCSLKANGAILPVIISPNSYVSKHAEIQKGTIVLHNAVVNSGSIIGQNCIINSKVLIEHGVIVNDHCHIATGALLNGDVEVGPGTFIGSGTMIKQGVKIGQNCVVGAGLRVMRNVPSGSIIKTSN